MASLLSLKTPQQVSDVMTWLEKMTRVIKARADIYR
jgi:hypothetical protein